jgi:hypothetical protein
VTRLSLGIAIAAAVAVPAVLQAQEAFESVVGRAAEAWTQHRTRDLVGDSDTVRLRIPGLAASAAVRPGQAVRLLGDYLRDAEELEFALQSVRHVAEGEAYAEFRRRFAVSGTSDVHEETVFLGYLQRGGQWHLREVRIAP